MKFRIIFEPDELTILTEDGGIACTRAAMPINEGVPRGSVSDIYAGVVTEEGIDSDNVFEMLSEHLMYHEDWETEPFNSLSVIKHALEWLSPEEESWELVDDLFTDIFGPN